MCSLSKEQSILSRNNSKSIFSELRLFSHREMFPIDFEGQWDKDQGHSDLQHSLLVCKPCPINN